MQGIFAALELVFWRVFMLLWPWLRWPKPSAASLRGDFCAGLTGAALVLPQGIAFARIAGLPPLFGLYSAMFAAVVAALFGSSWHLVSGPTVALSIVLPTVLVPYAPLASPEYVALSLVLMFLVGVIQLAFAVFRLGGLVNFISPTVVTGFTAGAGVLIVFSQLPDFFGVAVPHGLSLPERVLALAALLPSAHWPTLAIAATTLAVAVLTRRFCRRWPYMLVGMLAGSLLSLAIDGAGRGVAMLGALPLSAPAWQWPPLQWQTLRQLLPAAFAVALLGLINAVSIARAIAARSGQRIDGNQEFFGQGLANVVGSCCCCYVISGSFNRSGVNFDSGARSPLAQVFTAALVAAALALAPGITRFLPLAAMAGVIMLAAWNLLDFARFRLTLRTSRNETAILLATFVSTLLFSLDFAIYVGVILSLVLYLQKIAHPVLSAADFAPLYRQCHAADPAFVPPLRAVHLDGSIFFGSVDHIRSRLAELATAHEGRNLVILAEGLNRLDLAGIEMLLDERRALQQRGGDLYLIGMKPYLRRKLRRSPYWSLLGGQEHLFESTFVAFREVCVRLGIRNYRSYMKYLFRDYNRL